MPGLCKHEWEGSQMIAVFSKCDYNDEQDSESKKFSKMGVSKRDILISLIFNLLEKQASLQSSLQLPSSLQSALS